MNTLELKVSEKLIHFILYSFIVEQQVSWSEFYLKIDYINLFQSRP